MARLDGYNDKNDVLDAYSYGLSNDTLYGYGGNDTLYGWQGDDFLAGGEGNDLLFGEDGNDTLVGGPGNDTLFGSTGNDFYHVDSVYDVVTEYASQGVDTVRSRIHYTLGTNLEHLELDGTDNLTGAGNDLDNTIKGNSGNNNLFGAAGNDFIGGGLGNDTIFGGTGFDTASYSGAYATYYASFASDGAVKIIGSEGTDVIYDTERIYFGDGGFYNVYTGNASNNSLTADPNVWSMLYGGGGNDTLTGSNYNDTLTGGSGNDNIFGGSGFDIATYFGQYTSYGASFTSNGSVKITGSEGTDVLSGIERIYFGGGSGGFYNVYTGDGGNNILTADPNVWSMLYGGGGSDTLTGGKFNDTLAGGSSNDLLNGGEGNDILIGGSSKDTLVGGLGADKFRFEFQSEGSDLIKDFNRTQGDKIEIVKSSFGATSLGQFSYNSTTGALLFGSTQLATLENKPAGFSVQSDVVLV